MRAYMCAILLKSKKFHRIVFFVDYISSKLIIIYPKVMYVYIYIYIYIYISDLCKNAGVAELV